MPPEKQTTFDEDDFVQFVNDVIATEAGFGDSTTDVRKRIVDFYLSSDSSQKKDNVFYLRKYTQVRSNIETDVETLKCQQVLLDAARLRLNSHFSFWTQYSFSFV